MRTKDGYSLKFNAVAGFFARLLGFGMAFIQVPIFIMGMGVEAFGIWVVLAGWFGLISSMDFGMGVALQNITAAQKHRNGVIARYGWVESGTAVAALSGGIIFIVTLLCAKRANILTTLITQLELRSPPHWLMGAILVVAGCHMLNMPLAVVSKYAVGLQRSWLLNMGVILSYLVATTLAWIGLKFEARPIFFFWVLGGQVMFPNAIVYGVLWWRGEVRFWPSACTLRQARHLFRKGIVFMPTNAAASAMSNIPPILVGWGGGASEAAIWNSLARLSNVFLGLQQSLMLALWPALTAARAQRDFDWIRKAVRRATGGAAIFVSLPLALMLLWGPPVFLIWTKGAIKPTITVLVGYGLYAALQALAQPAAILLNSHGRGLGQGIYGSICVLLILITGYLFTAAQGATGIAFTCLLCFACVTLPLVWYQAAQLLSEIQNR